MPKRSLLTGVAYHGNRMPTHVRTDMAEIARADMDIVVHMLSHTDWTRHKRVMKDIFAITEDAGLEVWVDNWGLGGAPGDCSHFLAFHPDAHMYYSNGEMHPTQVCLNSPDYRKFVRDWIDTVAELGAKTIFWDEPHYPYKRDADDRKKLFYCCCCPRCQRLFEERYNRPFPTFMIEKEFDEDVSRFRTDVLLDYFGEMSDYAASLGLKNVMCVMLNPNHGLDLSSLDGMCSLPHLDNVGADPYWLGHEGVSPYEYVYKGSKKCVEIAAQYKKDHNVWIQTYKTPRGREEEIVEACEAAYDAGARTILAWGYMGSESNTYGAEVPLRTWSVTVEGMRRIRAMERDRILAENRKKYRF